MRFRSSWIKVVLTLIAAFNTVQQGLLISATTAFEAGPETQNNLISFTGSGIKDRPMTNDNPIEVVIVKAVLSKETPLQKMNGFRISI